ncbi:MAG: peptidylprolyl isomerase [Pseudomonadota bacterium]
MKTPSLFVALALLGFTAGGVMAPAMAQTQAEAGIPTDGNLFAPRLVVNDRVITQYEVVQRALFLKLLNAPVDPMAEALSALTDDRLRLTEAERLGLSLTPEEVEAAMTEFASRANLSSEEFVAALAQSGVEAATFRDFVTSGQIWRNAVRARYQSSVTVSEAEIDRAIASVAREKPLRVLLSELVIPMGPGDQGEAAALAAQLSDQIASEGAFAAAARQHSRSPTAGAGGRLDWMPLSNLPPQIAPYVLALNVGQVSEPVFVPGAVVLFQMREIAVDTAAKPASVTVEYARLVIPNDPAEVARIRAGADACMDLYGLTKGLPAEQLVIETRPMGEIPQDIGLELAKLDAGEMSAALSSGTGRMILMLCNRAPVLEEPIARDAVRGNLLNRKLEGLSEAYLEELRAAAIIRAP